MWSNPQFPQFFKFTREIDLVTFTREILENGKLSLLCSAIFNLLMDYNCTIYPSIFDALRDSVPFVQLKNVKNTHGGVLLLVTKHSSMRFFHVFKIIQMVPNHAMHHIFTILKVSKKNADISNNVGA